MGEVQRYEPGWIPCMKTGRNIYDGMMTEQDGDYVLYSDYAALQARIAELSEQLKAAEARNAASERDAAKWRNHVESSDASHTHRCRRCGWNYSPVAGTSEDCPACGFDGVGDAHAQGQA